MSEPGLLWKKWLKTVRNQPGAIAVIEAENGGELSRENLKKLAEKFHETFLGRVQGKKVALCGPNSSWWLVAFLAVQRGQGTVICMDAGCPPEKQEEQARALGAEWLVRDELDATHLGRGRNSKGGALVKLTSGSTGEPKQISCSAANMIADGRAVIQGMEIRGSDRNLALIPLSHSYALGNVVMPLLMQGTSAVLAKAFVPSQIPAWIHKYQVTVFPSVPVVFRLLAHMKATTNLDPLRLAISAGAALPAEAAAAFYERFGLDIHNFYGSSETGGICYDRSGKLARMGGGLGSALPRVKVSIAKSGNITVSGPAVATASGRFRLADAGRWVGKDILELSGRRDAAANIGGKKVNPAEIQHQLQKIPGVSEAWVGVIQFKQRDVLIAAVETALKEKTVEKELLKHLPAWKIPRLIRCLDVFPRNARGKAEAASIKEGLVSGFSGPG